MFCVFLYFSDCYDFSNLCDSNDFCDVCDLVDFRYFCDLCDLICCLEFSVRSVSVVISVVSMISVI